MKQFSLTGWCNLKLFLAFGILLILSSISWADIPNLINFQGILDSAGNPLANKTKSVEFKIYNDSIASLPANIKWSETQSVTTNAGGIFNVVLGTSNPIPDSAFDDTIRYLGVKVGTDAEMTPRQQIVSNAYGYRVGTVDGATGGTIFGNTSIQSDLYVDGKVGIGTTSPENELHIGQGGSPILKIDGALNTAGQGPKLRWTEVFADDYGVEAFLDGGSDALIFRTIDAGAVFLDNILVIKRLSGDVGIGTASPATLLHVAGKLTADSYTKLGSDAPPIRMKKLTGTTNALEGGSVLIAHGVTDSKIISIDVMVEYFTDSYIHPGYTLNPEYEFYWYSNGGFVSVVNSSTNSGNILSKPIKILITYEE